mgnify:CR=1 FL=1
MLLSPIVVFSQEEQPKRVTVVVTAKEIPSQKEVVQIPADNVPKNVKESSSRTTKNKLEAKAAKEVTRTSADKTKPVTSLPKAPKKPPVKRPMPIIKEEITTNHKPKEEKPVENSARKENGKVEKNTVDTSHTVAKVIHKNKTSLKPANAKAVDETLSVNSKKSAFSYIWIGTFLVIAGIVLGLLFGRPAFLVSFVGIVFIILGIII